MSDFKNTKEVMEHLIAGGSVQIEASPSRFWFFDEHGFIIDNQGDSSYIPLNQHVGNLKKYTKPEWYENIPKEGILCWVGDEDPKERSIVAVINELAANSSWPYQTPGSKYAYATPLTKEEIEIFIKNVPKEIN